MQNQDSFLEVLQVCESSQQPWPVSFYNPSNGVAIWSFKGAELNDEALVDAVLVANEYLLVPVVRKPLVVLVGLESKNRLVQKSFLSAPLQTIAVSASGSVCCGSSNEHLFTWFLSSGKMTSIMSGHYQAITKILFTTDDSFVVTCGKDGQIFVWNLGDLLIPHEISTGSKPAALHKLAAHSLAVTDIKVGRGGIAGRLYSVSLDQTAKIHCLSSGNLLMTLFFDCPVTSCTVNNAESCVFIGTSKGDIRQVDMFVEPVMRERHIDTSMNSEEKLFSGHKQSVTCLSVNIDGTMLASGSEDNFVKIWHINSRQCTRTISCKGSPRRVLFLPKPPSLFNADYEPSLPVQSLSKNVCTKLDEYITVRIGQNDKQKILQVSSQANDAMMKELLDEERLMEFKAGLMENNGEKDLTHDVEHLRRELAKTKLMNKKLYEFCVENVMK